MQWLHRSDLSIFSSPIKMESLSKTPLLALPGDPEGPPTLFHTKSMKPKRLVKRRLVPRRWTLAPNLYATGALAYAWDTIQIWRKREKGRAKLVHSFVIPLPESIVESLAFDPKKESLLIQMENTKSKDIYYLTYVLSDPLLRKTLIQSLSLN